MATSPFHGEEDVDDLKSLAEDTKRGLSAIQAAQRVYDRDLWDIADPPFANLRHLQIHLAISVGKFARLLEPEDHKAYNGTAEPRVEPAELGPIVADLVMHAAQISNVVGIDLFEVFCSRYRSNALRFAPDSEIRTFGQVEPDSAHEQDR